jgi:hypothetical protein
VKTKVKIFHFLRFVGEVTNLILDA